MNLKKCSACKKELSLNDFGKLSSASDGKNNRCKKCERLNSRKKRKKNSLLPHKRAINLFNIYKWKDKKNNRECDLDTETVIRLTSMPCEYCSTTKNIGLDRLDNLKGHTKNNVVPCCIDCNKIKSNSLTYDEMKLIAPIIKKIQDNRDVKLFISFIKRG